MTQLAASELLVRSEPRGSKRRFIGHFLEMIVVMSLGMAVLGAAFGALHDLLFGSNYAGAWREHVVFAAFGMAFNMTVPMVLWMRYRGHSWERGGEMAVAMNLPVLPLLALYAFDLLSERGVLCWQMTLMLPGMLGVMLHRKDEYTAPHERHVLPRLRWSREAGQAAMQATIADRATRLGGEERAAVASQEQDSPARVALIAGVTGLLANITYVLASAVPLGDIAEAVAASLFGPLIAAASVALYLLLAWERATLAGQMAAIANVVAAGLVTAMVLVQLSVNDVEAGLSPELNDAFEHVEFGLDVAWDVFLVAGTILFGCAMIVDRRFGPWLGAAGIIVAIALYALNFASFPTPPASDGLFDLGPVVGLWYAVVSIQALRLWRAMRKQDGVASARLRHAPLQPGHRGDAK